MFKKKIVSFSNEICKAYITVDKHNCICITCKLNPFLRIQIFTDCSIENYKEAFWKRINFAKAFESLCTPENVLFTTKKYMLFPRKVHTMYANKKIDVDICKVYINYP